MLIGVAGSTKLCSDPAGRLTTTMEGKLFVYDSSTRLSAFISGNDYSNVLVFIGGLTDGFLTVDYVRPLASRLIELGWSLVQFLTSSSYRGYGTSSLGKDSEELGSLLNYLVKNFNAKKIVLLGHSTGCQDIVYFLRNSNMASVCKAAILQAPVSDRDYFATALHEFDKNVQLASRLTVEGKSEELMPRSAFPMAPISAYRFHSFMGRLADDDMFSNDLSQEELQLLFKHVKIPCLLVFSMADEYVPKTIDVKALASRISANFPNSEHVFIEASDHNIAESAVQQYFLNAVIDFLKRKV